MLDLPIEQKKFVEMPQRRKLARTTATLHHVGSELLQKPQQLRTGGLEQRAFLQLKEISQLQKIALIGLDSKR